MLGSWTSKLFSFHLLSANGLDFLDLLRRLGQYFGRQDGVRLSRGRLRQKRTRLGQLGVALLELHHLRLWLLPAHGTSRAFCLLLLLLLLLLLDLVSLICLSLPFGSGQHLSG